MPAQTDDEARRQLARRLTRAQATAALAWLMDAGEPAARRALEAIALAAPHLAGRARALKPDPALRAPAPRLVELTTHWMTSGLDAYCGADDPGALYTSDRAEMIAALRPCYICRAAAVMSLAGARAAS